ncbi:MAG: DUF2142 domain-containing protein [Spirochaetes bacterium]|nr:DUF2142 domain-containing protein [Spirochaetota bacterium]
MRIAAPLAVFLVGLAYLILAPPFQVPDEYMHFGRTLNLLEGHARAEKQGERMGYRIPCAAAYLMEKMPKSVEFRSEGKYDWAAFWRLNAESQNKPGVCFWEIDRGSLQMHVPFLYAPQVVGTAIAKFFTSKPAMWLYAARAANLIFCFLVLFGLLKISPNRNLRLFFFATLPMLLHIFASASGDAMVIILAFVYFFQLLDTLSQREITTNRWIILGVSALFISVAKSIYFPLILLVPFAAWRERSRRAWLFATAIVLLSFVVLVGWNLIVRHDYYSTAAYGMAPALQVRHLLEHPIAGVFAVLRGFIDNAAKIAVTYFGVFGWLSVIMPLPWYLAYFIFGSFIFIVTRAEIDNLRTPRWPFVLVALGTLLLLSLVMYITFTPVGFAYTKGIQGRHLMPILPFLFAALSGVARWHSYAHVLEKFALPIVLCFHGIALWQIYARFN